MAADMNTTATASPAHEVSEAAAYTAGMNTTAASLTADALRQSTATANYDATHERVNDVARAIAEQTLALTNGRSTYSWEGNGIRLTYTGDTVDDQGDFAYGPTVREYLVDGVYKTTAPVPSQSGTGLLNLSLDHVRDCTDPVVEAKRQITWLLLDPSLDLVEYVIRTTTMWHGLLQTPHKLRTALAIRLAEVIEQKVLENPGGGLDLKDLLDGTNVVGYMVKTLDGSIFNLVKRIITNEQKHRTVLDTPVDDDDAYRRPVAELATEQLPASAELAAIDGDADARAIAIMEALHAEDEEVAEAKATNKAIEEATAQIAKNGSDDIDDDVMALSQQAKKVVRSRRGQEKSALVARAFLAQTGLPAPAIPEFETRTQFLAELAAEDLAYEEAAAAAKAKAAEKSAESGEKVTPVPVIREESIALRSFLAWHNLLNGESDPRDAEVSDAWLGIWKPYTPDLTEQMLAFVTGHEERVTKLVEGTLALPEPMSPATKKRIRDTMKRVVDHSEVNMLMSAAIDTYDAHLQGGDYFEWELAALAVLEHEHGPKLRPDAVLSGRELHLKKVLRGIEKKFAETTDVSPALQRRMLEMMTVGAGVDSVNIRFQVAIDRFAAFTCGGDYTEFQAAARAALDLQPSTAGTVADLSAAFDAAGAQLVH